MTPEQMLGEIEDTIRLMPPRDKMGWDDPDTLAWHGRAAALVAEWNPVRGVVFVGQLSDTHGGLHAVAYPAVLAVITTLHQLRHDVRSKTVGPLSVALPTGSVYDYFDEVRKVVAEATSEVFFIDPYLDADFVNRYLPHIPTTVKVRLLGREGMNKLVSATQMFAEQHGLTVEVRSAEKFHDRYVFIDSAHCFQSGASFKDGAKKTPTTLTEIGDAFNAVLKTYEEFWAAGTKKYP